MDGLRWYVVQTEPNRERLAKGRIEAEKFGTYLPMRESKARGSASPLFPSYLFVEFDAMEPSWSSILRMQGVVTILGVNRPKMGEHFPPPLPLPTGFVDGLKEFLDKMGGKLVPPPPPSLPKIHQGETVFVTEGPFAGFQALVDADEGERVRVLLDIFGRVTTTYSPRKYLATGNSSVGAQ